MADLHEEGILLLRRPVALVFYLLRHRDFPDQNEKFPKLFQKMVLEEKLVFVSSEEENRKLKLFFILFIIFYGDDNFCKKQKLPSKRSTSRRKAETREDVVRAESLAPNTFKRNYFSSKWMLVVMMKYRTTSSISLTRLDFLN